MVIGRNSNKSSDVISEDLINHPSHYMVHAMESIDEMMVVFGPKAVYDFCICNAWKYRYRSGVKQGVTSSMDNEKADWYLAKAKQIKHDYPFTFKEA